MVFSGGPFYDHSLIQTRTRRIPFRPSALGKGAYSRRSKVAFPLLSPKARAFFLAVIELQGPRLNAPFISQRLESVFLSNIAPTLVTVPSSDLPGDKLTTGLVPFVRFVNPQGRGILKVTPPRLH